MISEAQQIREMKLWSKDEGRVRITHRFNPDSKRASVIERKWKAREILARVTNSVALYIH